MIKGVIFDLDGVITDTAEYHYLAWKELSDQQGWIFGREQNDALRGLSRIDSLRIISKANGLELSEDEAVELSTEKNQMYVDLLDNISPDSYLPGAEELLKFLKSKRLQLGLGSSSKNARAVLGKLSATTYFDAVGDGYSVANSKPAPDLFLHVARKLGLSPSECIVFEDAESGVDAALAGGFQCVGIGPVERVGHATLRFDDMSKVDFEGLEEIFRF